MRYDAVLFDLLTALLDSWSLWNSVAGGDEIGQRWRAEYLRISYRAGTYLPYEDLVTEAAVTVGLDASLGRKLAESYPEIEPWPEVRDTLSALGLPLAIVTNCSEELGQIAAARVGVSFDVIVTAERAGYYKPDPRPYQLALHELGVEPARCLFVAGSAYDLQGTSKLGMPTFWHDRIGMKPLPATPAPMAHERSLLALPALVRS